MHLSRKERYICNRFCNHYWWVNVRFNPLKYIKSYKFSCFEETEYIYVHWCVTVLHDLNWVLHCERIFNIGNECRILVKTISYWYPTNQPYQLPWVGSCCWCLNNLWKMLCSLILPLCDYCPHKHWTAWNHLRCRWNYWERKPRKRRRLNY